MHYWEILYAKFDYSRVDGIIQTSEARKAFPTFKPLLKELAQDQIESGLISESDLLAVFTFILRYQEEPGFSNFIRWLTWKANPKKWDVWVSRTELAGILEYIADKVSSRSRTYLSKNRCDGKASKDDAVTPIPGEIDPWAPQPTDPPHTPAEPPEAPGTQPPAEGRPAEGRPGEGEPPPQSDDDFPDFGDDFPDFDEEPSPLEAAP